MRRVDAKMDWYRRYLLAATCDSVRLVLDFLSHVFWNSMNTSHYKENMP